MKILKMPRVTILTGKLIILRIGFKTKKRIANITPPVNNVHNPPEIVTPGIKRGRKNKMRA